MSQSQLRIHFDFRPVGQGLFSTGWLCGENDNQPRFRWVYDCGTSSEPALVDTAIRDLLEEVRGSDNTPKPRLDLVTISHFDWDHISGIVNLLKNFQVKNLLLPYMPLWQRLLLAFVEEIDIQQPGLIDFFLNPVAYILQNNEFQVENFIFVDGSGNEGPPIDNNAEVILPDGNERWSLDIVPPVTPLAPDDPQRIEMEALQGTRQPETVVLLKSHNSLRVINAIEFVPYNDASVKPKSDPDHENFEDFKNKVEEKKAELLNAPSETALKELRKLYDQYFCNKTKKPDPKMRNLISLFLYIGLMGKKEALCSSIHDGLNNPLSYYNELKKTGIIAFSSQSILLVIVNA